MTFVNYIELQENRMQIVLGISKLYINYSDIKLIKETKNPLASMALSLDRIAITYRGGEVFVSVKEKKIFMEELYKITSNL